MQGLTIGKLARLAEVSIDTVRFYERAGLLPQAARTRAGYRMYGDEAVARLRFIRRARAHGFTLDDAAELLKLSHGGKRGEVRRLAQRRLDDIEQRLRELAQLRDTLAVLVEQCDGRGNVKGCPIVNALAPDDAACHARAPASPRRATR